MNAGETIREIRKCCRLAMNGVVSANMREQGLVYKLNFGVSLMQIKDIAKRFTPAKDLAESLWKEDVRELKILATLLYPVAECDEETANLWAAQIPNQEIREQACANLFPRLPFSDKLAVSWAVSDSAGMRTTSYWLLARLLLNKTVVDTNPGSYAYIFDDILSDNAALRNAALLALKNLGRVSRVAAGNIIGSISSFKESEDILKKEIYESLKFEFDFYFE